MAIKPNYDNLHKLPLSQRSRIWTGCHGNGTCMPCGHVHNFSYSTQGMGRLERVDRFLCSHNYHNGCPRPIPEPVHKFNEKGRCTGCGYQAKYIAPDGSKHRTIAAARSAGFKPKELVREDKQAK